MSCGGAAVTCKSPGKYLPVTASHLILPDFLAVPLWAHTSMSLESYFPVKLGVIDRNNTHHDTFEFFSSAELTVLGISLMSTAPSYGED